MLKIRYINVECDKCGEVILPYNKIIECRCGQKIKYTYKVEKSPMDLAFSTLISLGYSNNEIRNAIHNSYFLTPQDMIEHVKKYVNRTKQG
jgi:Holliday junction resolvasome RuvABC DNA-binding subunit